MGYNINKGGEEPPVLTGENNPFAKHTSENVDEVKRLLKESELLFSNIAEITNYSESGVKRINEGIIWRDENVKYPIRKKGIIDLKDVKQIQYELLNTKKSQKEIAKDYGIARSTVTMINTGKNHFNGQLKYPLREERVKK